VKINIAMPFDDTNLADEFVNPEAVVDIAQLVERLGFHSALVTDHPCPTARWRDAGGHDAQDPFVMMSFIAAATTKLRVQTGILVLPYRNPFVTARAASTLDVFSGGRLTLGLGAGYLKGEYFAMGVDINKRNDLMDEYIQAMKASWTGEEFDFEGTGYSARGCRVRPKPLQDPIPLYVGGNSRRALRRAVELADGWNPFFTKGLSTQLTKTKSFAGEEDIVSGIQYMQEHCEKVGRKDLPEIVLASIMGAGADKSAQSVIDAIGRYEELGVAGAGTSFFAESKADWCDQAQQFSEDVLSKI
jgi:probable F420-dependent oxidoreductase